MSIVCTISSTPRSWYRVTASCHTFIMCCRNADLMQQQHQQFTCTGGLLAAEAVDLLRQFRANETLNGEAFACCRFSVTQNGTFITPYLLSCTAMLAAVCKSCSKSVSRHATSGGCYTALQHLHAQPPQQVLSSCVCACSPCTSQSCASEVRMQTDCLKRLGINSAARARRRLFLVLNIVSAVHSAQLGWKVGNLADIDDISTATAAVHADLLT